MTRKSIWCCGLMVAAPFVSVAAHAPAWADSAGDEPPAALVPVASYELPSQTARAISPPSTGLIREYGALSELKTTAAVAIAFANRKTVIPGPDLNYRAGQRGPLFEIAALGGGMDSAPALAHVGMDWIF